MSTTKTNPVVSQAEKRERILQFLGKNPNSTAAQIEAATKIAFIQVHAVAGKLIKENLVKVNATKQFSLTGKPVAEVKAEPVVKAKAAVVKVKVAKAETVKAAKAEPVIAKIQREKTANLNRDFGKYVFNGQEYRKGKLVLALIKQIVLDNPSITPKQLKDKFPDTMVRSYGVFKEAAVARAANKAGSAKQRYFTQNDQQIKLKDGTTIAVTNQISGQNMPAILAVAKADGYKITGK